MENTLRLGSLLIYIMLGIWLARRWLVCPTEKSLKYPSGLRALALFFTCWAGFIVLGFIQTKISIHYFDPNNFPDDKGLSASVAYDGTGNNVFTLFTGWITCPLFIAFAHYFPCKEKHSDSKTASPDTAP